MTRREESKRTFGFSITPLGSKKKRPKGKICRNVRRREPERSRTPKKGRISSSRSKTPSWAKRSTMKS
jgi:hypothetical protein